MSTLGAAFAALVVLGVGAGIVYVTSFSLIQEELPDERRGRAFGALYATVRVALLGALTLWPLVAASLDTIARRTLDDGYLRVGSWRIAVPGVRLSLWSAAAVILCAAAVTRRMMHPRSTGSRE